MGEIDWQGDDVLVDVAAFDVVNALNAAAAAATNGRVLDDTFSGDFGLDSILSPRFLSIWNSDDFGDGTSLLAEIFIFQSVRKSVFFKYFFYTFHSQTKFRNPLISK